jgi:hypothetical protein
MKHLPPMLHADMANSGNGCDFPISTMTARLNAGLHLRHPIQIQPNATLASLHCRQLHKSLSMN